MEVVVKSMESIKPSFPTPQHLLHYPISFFDQIMHRVFIPMLYFYPESATDADLHMSNKLKQSLSHVLSKFYCLAGRFKGNFVECNDEGVPYFEARANCILSQVVGDSCLGNLNKFLPFGGEREDAGDLALAIQVNFFNCGGIVIATCSNHKIVDALSLFYFINCWAATARGHDPGTINPVFELPKIFPQRNFPSDGVTPAAFLNQKMVAKRFVFSNSSLSSLKEKYTDSLNACQGVQPSRFEALAAFIWGRIVSRIHARWYMAFIMVNMRPRKNPPLSNSCFGNLIGYAMVGASTDPNMMNGSKFMTRTRDAVNGIDDNFIEILHKSSKPQEGDDLTNFGHVLSLSFSDVSKFPMYEADFGWGKPVWVTTANLCFKNTIQFFPTRSGDGVQVFLYLNGEHMTKLEADVEFLEFASESSGAVQRSNL